MIQLPALKAQYCQADPKLDAIELEAMAMAITLEEVFVDPWNTIRATKIKFNDPGETGVATVNNSGRESAIPGTEPVEGSPI